MNGFGEHCRDFWGSALMWGRSRLVGAIAHAIIYQAIRQSDKDDTDTDGVSWKLAHFNADFLSTV